LLIINISAKVFKMDFLNNLLMENRHVGVIIVIISLLIGLVIYSFNQALSDIVSTSCTHGLTCPMWGTINFQTSTGLGIMSAILLFGLYLIFFAKDKKQELKKSPFSNIKDLSKEERIILEKIIEEKGTIFQSELAEKIKMTKVKVTRILDKLEGKGLVERKRRGMSNVVILKH